MMMYREYRIWNSKIETMETVSEDNKVTDKDLLQTGEVVDIPF